MSIIRIGLPRGVWSFDDARPLGRPGGFGAVFEGWDDAGTPVAVKRLKMTAAEAAHRELRISDELAGRHFRHVLAPLDSGQDAESGAYFVVMPRADRSLADELAARGTFAVAAGLDVLRQIVAGLQEVLELTHRDLKPANVLLHEGHWKIADFGIARFVEDATSLNTLKDCLSPPFAAPEQWNAERATIATDIYALCCIAHMLFTGEPPYPGPTIADYKQQHVEAAPPSLTPAEPRLRALVAAGLRKPQAARPSLSRVATVLDEIAASPSPTSQAFAELQSANAVEAERISRASAEAEQQRRVDQERKALVEAGKTILREVVTQLEQMVREHAAEATVHGSATGALDVRLGEGAELHVQPSEAVPQNVAFERTTWQPVAIAQIQVKQGRPNAWRHGATLWYMCLSAGREYRWYEVSYKHHALMRAPLVGPFPIQELGTDAYEHADAAAGSGMHTIEIEFGPAPIDDEGLDSFVQRWLARLVQAYEGRLRPF